MNENRIYKKIIVAFSFSTFFNPTKKLVINSEPYKDQQQLEKNFGGFRVYSASRLFCTLFYLWWWWSCLFGFCCRSQRMQNQTFIMVTNMTSELHMQSIGSDEIMMKSTVINQSNEWYLNHNETKEQQESNR